MLSKLIRSPAQIVESFLHSAGQPTEQSEKIHLARRCELRNNFPMRTFGNLNRFVLSCLAFVASAAGCHNSNLLPDAGGGVGNFSPPEGTTPDGGSGSGGAALGAGSVLQHHLRPSRDGAYIEPTFTRDAARTMRMDQSFGGETAGATYAQPLYLDFGPDGRDQLFVATELNNVYLLDAITGAVIVERNLGRPARRSQLPCGNTDPLGVTGAPVIDPMTRSVFLDAMVVPDGTSGPRHMIFALSIDDLSTRPGWPVDVGARILDPVPFNSRDQNQRGALALLDGKVYVAYGAHAGDCGDYHGWVVGVSISDPSDLSAWFARAYGGGIWGPGGIASDGSSLFIATGNSLDATNWGDGESVIRLGPGLVFSQEPGDFFRPWDWLTLDEEDNDLGGSGPLLVTVPGSQPSRLAVAMGKNGRAYLLDATNLGGESVGGIFSDQVAYDEIINAATAYTTTQGTYVAFRGQGINCPNEAGDLIGIQISGTPPSFRTVWCATQWGVASPISTTTDGRNDPIVWGLGANGIGQLRAFDGETGEVLFDGGGELDYMTDIARFQTPIVAKGRIYVAGRDRVFAFSPSP